MLRAIGRHEPVTTSELTRVLGGHENTTRQHLDALHRDGYVRGAQNRGRVGRPSVAYSLSSSGLTHLAGRSASPEHMALVATLSDHLLASTDDPVAAARRVGEAWGRRLAGTHDATGGVAGAGGLDGAGGAGRGEVPDAEALSEVLDLLGSLGFSPAVEESDGAGDAQGDPVGVVLRTCPLLDAARESPDVVCTVHEGLVEGFLSARGSAAQVAVVPFAAPHGCRATITRG